MNYAYFKKAIENKGFTIYSLAPKIGITYPGLLKSFDNETLTLETFEKICQVMALTGHRTIQAFEMYARSIHADLPVDISGYITTAV